MRHLDRNFPRVIQPHNDVEGLVSDLCLASARYMAYMVDCDGNLKDGHTTEEWDRWSEFHDRILDLINLLVHGRGSTISLEVRGMACDGHRGL
jgi:hypothetical protein